MLSNLVIVGQVDAGKSALLEKLLDEEVDTGKTQAINHYSNQVLDTPGEYVENRSFYNALLTTISNIPTILFLHPADAKYCHVPPGLLQVYANKKIIGVISKKDLPNADIERSEKLIAQQGVKPPYFPISINDKISIDKLKKYIIKSHC